MIKQFFKINDDYKIAKYSLISIFVCALLAYNLILIYGFTNPDGINEGFYYYSAADWASQGCGRWLIRYFNYAHANIVMPFITLMEYCLFTWLTLITIFKVLDVKNIFNAVVTSILFILLPGVITQITYVYTAAAYCLSGLFTALFVYFNTLEDKRFLLLSSICLAFAMGLYQSYIGLAVALSLMYIIVRIIDGKHIKELLPFIFRSILSALVALALYFVFYKADLMIFGLDTVERMQQFSIKEIIGNFSFKFIEMYKVFFNNFIDGILKRNYLVYLFVIITLYAVFISLIKMIKEKRYLDLFIVVIGIILIPPASCIIGILIPFNNVNLMMSNQNYLIVPFVFVLLERNTLKLNKYINAFGLLTLIALSWTYMLSANATYRCYMLSYNHINSEVQMALKDVYALDDYVKDETPIIFAGFPNDFTLRENMPLYKYTIELYPNVIFWQDMTGVVSNRYNYLINCFGVDAGGISDEDYLRLMESQEFYEMNVWPKKNSIRMIDGYAVIKYSNNPLLPY